MDDRDRKRGPEGMAPAPDDEAEISRLLAEAGPRPEVPADHLAAIRTSAHEAWRQAAGKAATEAATPAETQAPANLRAFRPPRRSSWPVVVTLAASLLLAVGLSWWLFREPTVTPGGGSPAGRTEIVAHVESLTGGVWTMAQGERRVLASGEAVAAGSELATERSGRLALQLASGAELRLDQGTHLRLFSDSELELGSGALYADAAGSATLRISTRFGTVRDIGTRFTVALPAPGGLEVRVRDGGVELSREGGSWSATAGERITLDSAGRAEVSTAPAFGPGWEWVLDAAPPFAIEGRSLGELLDWASRETGWQIHFASPELAASKSGVRFQGKASLRPDSSLLAFLPTMGLEGELLGNVLTLSERR